MSIIISLCLFGSISNAQNIYTPSEDKTARQIKPLAYGRHQMVVTNNPLASKAAFHILHIGGNAVDAAITAALVLGLTEPQSSGLGGGGFALTYMANTGKLHAYDGREIAPRTATSDWFLQKNGQPMDLDEAMLSYRSIGIPGEVSLLATLHQRQGKLEWDKLVQPAIQLAKRGFPMSPRLHALLVNDRAVLIKNPMLKAIYFTAKNKVKPLNRLIINLPYAKTLQMIAHNPQVFYTGSIGTDLIKHVNQLAGWSVWQRDDLVQYKVLESDPICLPFRNYRVCTTPFASGGVTLLQLLQLYAYAYTSQNLSNPNWLYYFLEASKLAYADRSQYIADPQFFSIPMAGLLARDYLHKRSHLIHDKPLVTPVAAGVPKGVRPARSPDNSTHEQGTTALTIVDKEGNAVVMTVTIEHQFGSHQFIDGFFLNNELTDFSFLPKNKRQHWVANRVEPQKRPRSAIAPSMVFNQQNQLVMLVASPGGAPIICYVAKNLIHMIDFKQSPRDSSASGNLCAMNEQPIIEANSDLIPLQSVLKRRKEKVTIDELLSGVTSIKRSSQHGWLGAADPRREGVAIGD